MSVDRSAALDADRSALDGHACLFERYPRIYAFCREHLFRDDTERICRGLWPDGHPEARSLVLEVGCGPGLYARRLALRFPSIDVVGIDHSEAQLRLARRAADAQGLSRCRFEGADARSLPHADASVDSVIVSRLFTVLHERGRTLAEIHRVLRPGGRLFVAEPRSPFRAALPLAAMRMADRAARLAGLAGAHNGCGEQVRVMDPDTFGALTGRLPWARVRRSADRWYQYAVCERAR